MPFKVPCHGPQPMWLSCLTARPLHPSLTLRYDSGCLAPTPLLLKSRPYVTHNTYKQLTFRVSGLPDIPPAAVSAYLGAAIKEQCTTDELDTKFNIVPLPSCYEHQSSSLVALLRFVNGTPDFLTDVVGDPLNILQIPPPDSEVNGSSITIDRHFHGFTQLYSTDPCQEIAADIVAITGMDANAYGSWMTKDGSNTMWLQEFLSNDLPDCRTMIYGYQSKLSKWNMNQLSEYGREFFAEISKVRFDDESSKRPLFFLAHSYGGIVLAHCLIRAFRATEKPKESIHKSTYGVLFFGTPHRGSVKEALLKMVEQPGNPRKLMLLQTEPGADVLRIQLDDFSSIIEDRKIESFYETELIPAPEQDASGKWSRTGPMTLQVSEESSVLSLPGQIERKYPVNANHSNMIKFRSPQDATYTTVLAILREYKRDAPHIVEHRHLQSPLMPSSKFTVPFRRDVHFLGRKEILNKLQDILHFSEYHHRAALVGLGGIGKSQIAIEYAWRLRGRSPQTSVFWVHASNSARFNQSYHYMADRLDVPDRDLPNVNILQLVFKHLSDPANGQWLLILDNIEDYVVFDGSKGQDGQTEARPPNLAAFLPEVAHGAILVTSRNKIAAGKLVGEGPAVLEVTPMNDSDALALLRARSGDGESLVEDCTALLHGLGNIPLAVTQAAAFISQKAPRMTIARYLGLFSQSIKKRTMLLETELSDIRRYPDVANALLATWRISFEQLRERYPGSAELLGVMCHLDSQAMPESLLLSKYGNEDLQFESRLAPLISYSFITHEIGQISFSMHRLVQLATKNWLKEHDKSERHQHEAMDLVVRAFPDDRQIFQNWAAAEALSPHAEVLLSQPPSVMNTQQNLAMATLLHNTACHAALKGDFNTAFVKSVSARDTLSPIFGWGNPLVVASSDLITNVLSEMGKRDVAIRMQRVALARRAASLGTSHQNSHTSLRIMAKLGELLRDKERPEEARVFTALAVEGLIKIYGPRDPHTLAAMRTAALLQYDEGLAGQAEASLKRVLETRREVLGDNDLDTLISIGDLADFYSSHHQYKSALPLYATACTAVEQALGPNHRTSLELLRRYAHANAQSHRRRNTLLNGRIGRLLDNKKYRDKVASFLFSVSLTAAGLALFWNSPGLLDSLEEEKKQQKINGDWLTRKVDKVMRMVFDSDQ